jgi:hypothetical protein
VRHHDQAVRATARRVGVVVAGGEAGQHVRELTREARAVDGRPKAHLRVERQRGQTLVGPIGTADELADFADDAGGERDQVAGREVVRGALGVGRGLAEGAGRHDVRGGAGLHDALGEAAARLLPDQTDEPVRLEHAQVVVHTLAWQTNARGERTGRAGLGKLGEEPRADGLEGRHGGGRVVDDVNLAHGDSLRIDRKICQIEDQAFAFESGRTFAAQARPYDACPLVGRPDRGTLLHQTMVARLTNDLVPIGCRETAVHPDEVIDNTNDSQMAKRGAQ